MVIFLENTGNSVYNYDLKRKENRQIHNKVNYGGNK